MLTDPNGLLYMRTRFYNPELKRFMNADIIDGSIADSTTLNLYTYVNGNPISFVDPFGLSTERVETNYEVDYNAVGQIIRNPWSELNYPGEVHNAVVRYLATKYGLEAEHVPLNNRHNRYDLYSYETNAFWEVKPVTYSKSPARYMVMQGQMALYEADGVIRGIPLGYDETLYNNYTVKIYSELPGEVFYAFEYEQKLIEEPVKVADPAYEKESQKKFSVDWNAIGEGILGGVTVFGGILIVGVGIYQVVTTGDSSTIQQGWQTIVQGIG